jgi:hypothetical protein
MKKIIVVLIAVLMLAGCLPEVPSVEELTGETAKPTQQVEAAKKPVDKIAEQSKEAFNSSNIEKLASDPDKYKGAAVDFTGKILGAPEKDEDGTYFQMYGDPKNLGYVMVVGISDPNLQIKADDYVKVTGEVRGAFEGENAFGAAITAPALLADKVEVVSYMDAVSPTIKAIEVNQDIEQNGLTITLQKIEFAADETRIYLKAKNDTKDKASIYTSTATIVQSSKQYEEQYNFDANYPEFPSDMLPSVEAEAVMAYEAIDANTDFYFVVEGRSDNYSIDFEPYKFDVSMK